MQSTGIIRRVDDLGRVIIPKNLRRINKIREGDPMEVFVSEEGGITFVPYETTLKRAPSPKKSSCGSMKIAYTVRKFLVILIVSVKSSNRKNKEQISRAQSNWARPARRPRL